MNSINPKTTHPAVITIDGPAGAGKSTVAKTIAKKLGFAYLDTGAMYRALTLKALQEKINLEDEKQLVALSRRTSIDIDSDEKGTLRVLLDGQNVSDAIRSLEVTNNTAFIARIPGVRQTMVERQREIGLKKNIVVEGRDTGTVVFPNAAKKFYLDADFKERSRRRIDELRAKGNTFDEALLTKDLEERDKKDLTRKVGPLKKADDAIIIDSTHLTIDGVVEAILKHLK